MITLLMAMSRSFSKSFTSENYLLSLSPFPPPLGRHVNGPLPPDSRNTFDRAASDVPCGSVRSKKISATL